MRRLTGKNWRLFFLKLLKKQKDRLAAKLERENLPANVLPVLSGEILILLRERQSLTIAEIETLTVANRNTLKVRLRELVHDSFLEQTGRVRASRYWLKAQ